MDQAPPPYDEATKQPPYNTEYNQASYAPAPGGPPPQHGYPQPMPQMQQPQPTSTTIIVTAPSFGPNPVPVQCSYCHANVLTNVRHESGACAWLSCFICCILGCDAGCCLIPFCIDDCQDVIHNCANCNRQLGVYKRL